MPTLAHRPDDDVSLDPALLPFTASLAEGKKSVVAFKYMAHLLETCEPGEKLPSERDIADTLGMTRSPVHEALIALKMAGRVRIEPGVGAFVVPSDDASDKGSALHLLAESESPHEVFQLRVVVEEVILRTLVPELTTDRLEQIERSFRQLSEAMKAGGIEAYVEANRAFHMSLAAATGNSLLAKLEHWMLYEMMTQRLWREVLHTRLADLGKDMDSVIRALIEEHGRILAAIRSRDVESAVTLMLRHVGRIDVDVDDQDKEQGPRGVLL